METDDRGTPIVCPFCYTCKNVRYLLNTCERYSEVKKKRVNAALYQCDAEGCKTVFVYPRLE